MMLLVSTRRTLPSKSTTPLYTRQGNEVASEAKPNRSYRLYLVIARPSSVCDSRKSSLKVEPFMLTH